MFRPVGSQPPSVYWRRRLIVLGSIVLLLVLLVLTVKAATRSSGSPSGAAGGSPTAPASHPSTTVRTSPPPSTSHPPSSSTHRSTAAKPPVNHSTATPPAACAAKNLTVAAVVGKPSYKVGDSPQLELQVTNKGSLPCVQDLADKQVELRVYNGESRVWGSHDCQVQPGTDPRTLAVKTPVRVAITWTGLSSQPKCVGTRQRVGAGSYTLYAVLSGQTGTAAQFTIN